MARYNAPPDPRDSRTKMAEKRPFNEREPIPWRWLGMGIIVTLAGLGLSLVILRAFLVRQPLPVTTLEPTVIFLTAPPSPTPSPLSDVLLPTPVPTITPAPTLDISIAPESITPGYYAQVVNTDDIGVTVRGGPSTSNVPLKVAPEGSILLILDGPTEGGDFFWWQVRLDDGTEGWVAADFLTPAAAP